jgi:hypothetical protein
MEWLVVASNSSAGINGPLVTGPATFVLTLYYFDGATTTTLDTKSVAITLVSPPAN